MRFRLANTNLLTLLLILKRLSIIRYNTFQSKQYTDNDVHSSKPVQNQLNENQENRSAVF